MADEVAPLVLLFSLQTQTDWIHLNEPFSEFSVRWVGPDAADAEAADAADAQTDISPHTDYLGKIRAQAQMPNAD